MAAGSRDLPTDVWRLVANGLAACLTLVAVLWAIGVPRMAGVGFYPKQ
jgi:hypothetical protein